MMNLADNRLKRATGLPQLYGFVFMAFLQLQGRLEDPVAVSNSHFEKRGAGQGCTEVASGWLFFAFGGLPYSVGHNENC